MDLKHMRHFVAVAEHLHFGRAARQLNMAQPPLSQSIRRLEADLGVQLFDRSHRFVELTPAGQVLLREARRTLMHADLAAKLVRREAARPLDVRVGFIGPALYRLLPDLLAGFLETESQASVKLYEQPTPLQVQSILGGDADVGFVTAGSLELEGCESLIVERASLVAAIPTRWPISDRKRLSLAQLAEYPFILPPPQKYAAQPSAVLQLFSKTGQVPPVTQESTHANTTISLVGAGLGFSLITATACLAAPKNVSFIPIDDLGPGPHWGLMMIWRADHLSQTSRAFVSFARQFVEARPDLMRFETSEY